MRRRHFAALGLAVLLALSLAGCGGEKAEEERTSGLYYEACGISPDAVLLTVDGREVTLTTREFAILAMLMEHPKRAFSRAQIYESIWGEEFMGDDNTVNVHVSNLRSKLGKAAPGQEFIKTVWGIGFKMA